VTDYEEKIERGLILFLREEFDVKASRASIGETEIERGFFGGCDTCGYGSDEDEIFFYINYSTETDQRRGYARLEGSTLNFLPTILPYIERAN
jgi:hypothetical protein